MKVLKLQVHQASDAVTGIALTWVRCPARPYALLYMALPGKFEGLSVAAYAQPVRFMLGMN
jgi:hypothetical protein